MLTPERELEEMTRYLAGRGVAMLISGNNTLQGGADHDCIIKQDG